MTDVIRGDARNMDFLDDNSVDLICTSPPYWGLRSYRDDGEHYDGQVGSEDTPQQFVDELVGMIDDEWRRVLKPVGSLWLNLGDKYAGGGMSGGPSGLKGASGARPRGYTGAIRADKNQPTDTGNIRHKSLLGLPWRVALALIDRGWILRAEVIWSKPNGLPESVTDRVRRSHEQWFHFTLLPQYFAAVDEIREPHAASTLADPRFGNVTGTGRDRYDDAGMAGGPSGVAGANPLGRTPGSVWTIPTDPLLIPDAVREQLGLVDHFAAFPQEWPRRLILGWSPSAICKTCSEGLRPVSDLQYTKESDGANSDEWRIPGHGEYGRARHRQPSWGGHSIVNITGYECACPEPGPTRPSVVLDPFGGTGTTAGVARMLGRHGISVDLSEDYCRLARWRIFDSGHFSKTEDRSWADRQTTLI